MSQPVSNEQKLLNVLALLARWRKEVENYRRIIAKLKPNHPELETYKRPADCVQSCADELEFELTGERVVR